MPCTTDSPSPVALRSVGLSPDAVSAALSRENQEVPAGRIRKGEQVRVLSKSKDDLQATMTFLKGKDFGIDLQFTNYR